MGWDEQSGVTEPQRSKEGAEDYRYFPEPDLPPLLIGQDWLDQIRARLPELPAAKQDRFLAEYQLTSSEAGVLVADKAVADYFEAAASSYDGEPKTISNWVSGELFHLMSETGTDTEAIPVPPEALAELASMVDKGVVNTSTARYVLGEMFATGEDAARVINRQGLGQISDPAALAAAVRQVLADNPRQVGKYLEGKETVAGWLMGQVMQATSGKANPRIVQALLTEQLHALKRQL